MTDKLQYGFCGSGKFAAGCLSLLSEKIKPRWVVTNASKPAGRGLQKRETPVFRIAEGLGIETCTTGRLSSDEEALDRIKGDLPDVILVIDFGQMIKEPLLSLARLGCVNVHPSLLPAYRGSAPVQRALMDGLRETGVTLFRLDEGMDTGPVLAQASVEITDSDDTYTLFEKTSRAGTEILLEYLLNASAEDWVFTPQKDEGVSFAPKIDKSEGRILWHSESREIFNRIRALGFAPGTYCDAGERRLRIYRAQESSLSGPPGQIVAVEDGYPVIACGSGSIKLLEVQPEGRKIQNADEWLRGSRLNAGGFLQ